MSAEDILNQKVAALTGSQCSEPEIRAELVLQMNKGLASRTLKKMLSIQPLLRAAWTGGKTNSRSQAGSRIAQDLLVAEVMRATHGRLSYATVLELAQAMLNKTAV